MIRTTDHTTTPTGPVSHSDRSPDQGGRRRGTAWARIAVASTALLAGSITVATQAAASDDFENRCATDEAGSPDSLERRATACRIALDEAYAACMRDAAGTPDSAERWVEYCRTRALG